MSGQLPKTLILQLHMESIVLSEILDSYYQHYKHQQVSF